MSDEGEKKAVGTDELPAAEPPGTAGTEEPPAGSAGETGPDGAPAPERDLAEDYFLIPRPKVDGKALLEVLGLVAAYILITRLILSFAFTGEAIQDLFEGPEARLVAGFFLGAMVQLIIVVGLHAKGQEDIRRARVKVSRSIAETVLRKGEPVICTDAAEEAPFSSAESVVEMQLRSILCVPLREGDEVIGAIYLDNRLKEGAFHDAHLRLLEAFADQAAMAVTNARLHEQNEERRVEIEKLNEKLRNRVEHQQTELDRIHTRLDARAEPTPLRHRYESIIGRSDPIRRLLVLVDKVVDNDLPVLVLGDSGTGKELVARSIHFNGPRKSRPFAAENCAALAESLLESELFGHVKGAFTGAHKDRRGLFEVADGGTLFLDEIGDMGIGLQSKLLRVLETGEIRPVGATQARRVNVRIISATNRDLAKMVEEKEFREDLFYRLNTVAVQVPPLRERREDVPLLVDHFLDRIADKTGRTKLAIESEVVAEFARRDWPGNVRQLENEVFRLSVMERDGKIGMEALSEAPSAAPSAGADLSDAGTLTERVEAVEREMIGRVLGEHDGNRTRAAAELGISRNALLRKIGKYGLEG